MRAAEVFYEHTGITPGIKLELHKGIPYQAGLGSGSAGAAAALAGLNAMYGNLLSAEQLLQLGLKVGADVPFALTGGTCLAEGIGENLTQLPHLADCRILLAKPANGISTQEAYRRFDQLSNPKNFDSRAMVDALRKSHLPDVCREINNALEQVCTVPEVFSLKSMLLNSGALGAGMSGSGSAVFGIFPDAVKVPDVNRLAAELELQGTRFFWTRPVQRGIAIDFGCLDS
jgi:4-diphosphocytidyl-2-C-methyl-D-erythritol kinase